ncbi:MAG: tRNA (adenosine(37)-N6)-dimethylallyltransferase MiaA [Clostridiales bacterium]|jgi:tRNA dimethylallyltransferase|nr:tRNA (adenosine(37)-N6)-dimethylallyltransferase MiaA [Clostridiales bacterium]
MSPDDGAAPKPPVIVIAGPTASGKTAVSIRLAEKIGGEIISADSMQVYKRMDIGTAKPTRKERRGVRHYMLDEVAPDEEFSAAEFTKRAALYARDILARGKALILAGGSGFYINAFLTEARFARTENDYAYRAELSETVSKRGAVFLHERLKDVDPVSYDKIHFNDVKRVIRALEFYKLTGERISEHNRREKLRPAAYDAAFFTLSPDRQVLYERVERRADLMMAAGLLDETRGLLEMGYDRSLTAMQGLGYKEAVSALKGESSVEDAVSALKRNTRRFAKRQMTWFKNQNDGVWVDIGEGCDAERIAENILEMYNERLNGKDF